METKFESSIREIDYPQQAVYQRLSDLTLSEEVRDRLIDEQIKLIKDFAPEIPIIEV